MLETYGSGDFAFGYPSITLRVGFGGMLDTATGLLYVGDGQYGVYPACASAAGTGEPVEGIQPPVGY